jgi:hypothetical protein
MSPNQPTSPHIHVTSTSYTLPPNHFTGMTSNISMVSDPLLVGTHAILSSHFTSSTIVLQVTPFFVESSVTIKAPIGTPLSSRSNPSLPPRYNSLSSITNPTQGPSRGPSLFFPPGYNALRGFIPNSTLGLSRGPSLPVPPRGSNITGRSSSNLLGGTNHPVTSGFQLPIGGYSSGGQPQVGRQPQFGGHNLVYGQSMPRLQTQPWNFPFQGNQQLPRG